jgi:hypothetical protein
MDALTAELKAAKAKAIADEYSAAADAEPHPELAAVLRGRAQVHERLSQSFLDFAQRMRGRGKR